MQYGFVICILKLWLKACINTTDTIVIVSLTESVGAPLTANSWPIWRSIVPKKDWNSKTHTNTEASAASCDPMPPAATEGASQSQTTITNLVLLNSCFFSREEESSLFCCTWQTPAHRVFTSSGLWKTSLLSFVFPHKTLIQCQTITLYQHHTIQRWSWPPAHSTKSLLL